MEAPNPTRLVTTSNSITEGRKLAICRPFEETSELQIVKKNRINKTWMPTWSGEVKAGKVDTKPINPHFGAGATASAK